MSLELDDDDPRIEDLSRHVFLPSRHTSLAPRNDLVPGYLGAGELSCIFGASGQTKSVLAIDHACRLAAGLDWANKPTDPHWVLYIATERSAQVKRRVAAFAAAHELPPPQNLVVYDGPLDLTRPDADLLVIEEVCRRATWYDGGPEVENWHLIVIDTLAAGMSRPVSDTNATNAAAHNLTNLARVTGAHVMTVHHQPVSGEARMSGGHLPAAMDTIVRVRKTKAGSVAQVVKDNGHAESDWVRLTYRVKGVEMAAADGSWLSEPVVVPTQFSIDEDDETDEAPTKPAIKIRGNQREVLDALSGLLEAGTDATEANWRAVADLSAGSISESGKRKRFDRAKEWLLAQDLVERTGDNFKIGHPDNSDNDGTDILS